MLSSRDDLSNILIVITGQHRPKSAEKFSQLSQNQTDTAALPKNSKNWKITQVRPIFAWCTVQLIHRQTWTDNSCTTTKTRPSLGNFPLPAQDPSGMGVRISNNYLIALLDVVCEPDGDVADGVCYGLEVDLTVAHGPFQKLQ